MAAKPSKRDEPLSNSRTGQWIPILMMQGPQSQPALHCVFLTKFLLGESLGYLEQGMGYESFSFLSMARLSAERKEKAMVFSPSLRKDVISMKWI